MAPMGPPFPPFGTTAKVPSSDSTVRMMRLLRAGSTLKIHKEEFL